MGAAGCRDLGNARWRPRSTSGNLACAEGLHRRRHDAMSDRGRAALACPSLETWVFLRPLDGQWRFCRLSKAFEISVEPQHCRHVCVHSEARSPHAVPNGPCPGSRLRASRQPAVALAGVFWSAAAEVRGASAAFQQVWSIRVSRTLERLYLGARGPRSRLRTAFWTLRSGLVSFGASAATGQERWTASCPAASRQTAITVSIATPARRSARGA